MQIDSVEIVLRRLDLKLANTRPEKPEEKRAIHLKAFPSDGRDVLLCRDFEFLGYEDWRKGFEKARTAREGFKGGLVTPDMHWPNFWGWNSPVHVTMKVRSTFWGNLKFAQATIAVADEEFHISSVVDDDDNALTKSALEKLFLVRGYGFEPLFENQLSDKKIEVFRTLPCQGFVIYDLVVK